MSNNDQIQVTSSLNPRGPHRTVTRNNSLWKLQHLTSHYIDLSGSVSWTTFGATPRCHLVFIGFFPSANTVLILKELKWLLISLQCRGRPSDPVDAQSSLWPWPQMLCLRGELCFTSLQQQHCTAVHTKVLSGSSFLQVLKAVMQSALTAARITGGRQESHWDFLVESSLGLPCAVLRLPKNGPVGVGCCPSPGPQSFLLPSCLGENLSVLWPFTHILVLPCCWKTLAAVEVIQPGMWAQCKPDCLCGMNLWLWKLAVAMRLFSHFSIFLAFSLKNTQWQIIAINIQS